MPESSLAKLTDAHGQLVGLHRTGLDPLTSDEAPLDPARKAMGKLLGHEVRFGRASDLLGAGEGIETALSVRLALPRRPVIAALSAHHLTALALPPRLKRLFVVDADAAGARLPVG